MQPLSAIDARQVELLRMGDLLAHLGGQELALKIAKRGGNTSQFFEAIAARTRETGPTTSADAALGFDSRRDASTYSICRLIRAQAEQKWTDAGLELDLSNLATTKSGTVPNGFYVPLGIALREFNAGTAGEAGNLIGATIDGARAADPLRKASVLAAMGATILPGLKSTLSIPRFTSSDSAAWKSEVAAAGTITETTARVELTPKRSAVVMVLSRQALIQATPELDQAISRQLTAALIELLEYGAINGDGSNDAPVGIRNTAGVTDVVGGVNGSALAYDHLVDLENGPGAGNCPDTEFSGFLVNTKTRKGMRQTQRGAWSTAEIWEGGERPLLGYRAGVTNNLPSNLEKGSSGAVCSSVLFSSDWSQLFIAIYGGGIDLTVDRVTLASSGQIRVVAALHAGVAALVPAAFAKMDDAIIT